MKPLFKWALWSLCGLLAALVVVAVLAPMAANSRAVQQWALRRVNTVIRGALSVDELQVSLAAGKIRARGVVVSGADGAPIARVARLQGGISWLQLLHGVL